MTLGMILIAVAIVAWGLGVSLLAWRFREPLLGLWREPVLRHPVLIVESDDWGPGPPEQAQRLVALRALLGRFRDRTGRAPVMTLGVVLAVPERPWKGAAATGGYRRRTLADERDRALRTAMLEGAREGVFDLQLHGLEHFWPPALLAAAATDAGVRAWLADPEERMTEALPPALQSRWTDGSVLPSRPLESAALERAAREEADLFADILARSPEVAVPPTFVWDERVERAWAQAGVGVVVTPGRRYRGRDSAGALVPEGPPIRNGDRGARGVRYVVRDAYFEPMLGHDAEVALEALERRARSGRPTLLETHRANFVGDPALADRALAELERLLSTALERYPDLRFLSTAELARALEARAPELVERALGRRLNVWLERLAEIGRLRKLAWCTGLIAPAWLVRMLTRSDRTALASG